ncbi:MAG: SCE4755 family polysaccharide monooxygenase-like protein [Polyangiaceae bacterium]
MTSKLFSLLVAASATLIAADAAAHIDLMIPESRTGNADQAQKTGPCEGAGPGTRMDLTAGDPLMVTWDETIQHPGHFRIAIDEDGEDGFSTADTQAAFDDIMGNNGIILVETVGDTPDLGYEHEITVPNVDCENCTLQLVQVMVDGDPIDTAGDLYFRCADIRITGATGEGGAGGGSGNGGSSSNGNGGSSSNGNGGSSANGSGASGSGEGGGSNSNPSTPSGETHDCAVRAVGASSPGSSLAMALGLGAIASLAAARRRRRA